jgi:hypothetical protein
MYVRGYLQGSENGRVVTIDKNMLVLSAICFLSFFLFNHCIVCSSIYDFWWYLQTLAGYSFVTKHRNITEIEKTVIKNYVSMFYIGKCAILLLNIEPVRL